MSRRRLLARVRRAWPVLVVAAVALLVRAPLVAGQPLWTDEFFSLAMATGHGLEHPADEADPARGDFVEHAGPRPIDDYAAYLAPAPGADAGRVVEAVRRSDTNPPLYYLALAGWIGAFGPGDGAVRGFSLVASLLTLVPLAWLARRTVGPRGVVPACALFALLPASVYYGTEGRMYSLLVLLATTTLALAVRFHRRGVAAPGAAAFVLVATAGLLTHHFFVFPLAAAGAWLLLHPGRASRARVAALGLVVGVLVAPWYVQVPALMSGWRVTAGWLEMKPHDHHALLTPLGLPWSFFSTRGAWGGRRVVDVVQLGAVAVPIVVALRAWRAPRARLLWLAMLTPCAGVLAVDLALGTYAAQMTRYALAGLPAAALLLTLGLVRLPARARVALLLVVAAASLVGVRRMALADARNGQPYRVVAGLVVDEAGPDDLVLVHSIPSGVAGLARELRRELGAARGPDLAAWVGQLGQRDEADMRALVRGRSRVVLVEVHRVGDPPRPREWLAAHGRLEREKKRGGAHLYVFRMDGDGEVTK